MSALPAKALFPRNWKVILWNSPSPTLKNPPPPLDVSALDIEFRILRSLKPQPNRAVVTLWNINEEHRALLLRRTRDDDPGSPNVPVNIYIEAGYRGQTSVIFSGDLREVTSRREHTDWRTTLSLDDGGQAIAEARFPKGGMSFPKGAMVGTVLKQACTFLNIGIGNAEQFFQTAKLIGASDTKLPFKMTLTGSVYTELNRVCQSVGLDCSIQGGVLQILPKGFALGGDAIVLGPDSGLIDSPESAQDTKVSLGFAKEARDAKAQTPSKQNNKNTSVVKCKSLMIPGLVPGRRIKLEAAQFVGIEYVITEVEYVGQSWASEWYAVMVLRVYQHE